MSQTLDPIKHVVVLMLENRSFDHLLGDLDRVKPGLDGIANARTYFSDAARQNTYPPDNTPIAPAPNAQRALDEDALGDDQDFDPKHEHPDVVAQLGGDLAAPVMKGFVGDALNKAYQGHLPPARKKDVIGQVMAYFPNDDTPSNPVGALQALAREFTVCDRWFSSLPGPTWPNRFFALTGTAKGYLKMPEGAQDIGLWLRHYDMDTIFNRVHDAGHSCRVYYHDVSLTKLLRGTWRVPDLLHEFSDFAADVAAADSAGFPEFVFIEPKFFGLFGRPNDQHPPHDVALGDHLVADVYNALRGNARLWNDTLLVVLYDEHGGFCDHAEPPTTVAPDGYVGPQADFGFDFRRLGVRVPAVLASPWIDEGVDHTDYDHTSLLNYLCRKWALAPLGQRCAQASTFENLFLSAPRVTPATLPKTALPVTRALLQPGRPLPTNANQRALAAMLDYLGDELNLVNQDDSALDLLQRGGVDAGRRVLRKAEEVSAALRSHQKNLAAQAVQPQMPPSAAALAAQPLRVLMVHGIGHGDDQEKPQWKTEWESALRTNAQAAGYAGPMEVEFAAFDDIFEQYPLDAITIARGLALLAEHADDPPPSFGRREVTQRGLVSTLRWTAGMVLQWIENPALRQALNQRLLDTLTQDRFDLVCAHSLGAMACYDALRQRVAAGGGATFNGRCLLTFGSQFAHPAVQSVFGGRIEPLYDAQGDGFAQWYHLFNPHDHVFTRPLPGGDARTHGVVVEFDIPFDPLNHDGAHYLGDPVTASEVLPQLLPVARPAGWVRGTPAVASGLRPSKRRALLVGINDYPDPAMRLNGCVNDVYLLSALLQECGFDPDDIRVLSDGRATRAAMLERLDWLASGVREGDERVFFYSGHGAQMSTQNADGEPDQCDETLVPADFDWSREHAFTDKEFYQYYSHFPYAAEFVAIFDCCHAGGMTRGGQRVRGIEPPDDLRHRELRWSPEHQMWVPRNFAEAAATSGRALVGERRPHGRPALRRRGLGEAKALWSDSSAAFDAAKARYGTQGPYVPLLIYAAGESELAAEYDHGAVAYGAFTFALAKRARQDTVPPRFQDLVEGVRDELRALGYQQTPQLAGPQAKREATIPLGLWRRQ